MAEMVYSLIHSGFTLCSELFFSMPDDRESAKNLQFSDQWVTLSWFYFLVNETSASIRLVQ